MKVVIFAGGFGTRISEESAVMPKPLIEIGGKPILWHIMKLYAAHGHKEFIICCGYKGHLIKQYFADYFIRTADITFDLSDNTRVVHAAPGEDWKVTCVHTGLDTMTGGRLRRVKDYLNGETFCLTYGDGVTDVNINELIDFHKSEGALATLTAVQQPGRFGALRLDDAQVASFREKAARDGAVINGGFFVVEPEVIDFIDGDETVWEQEPMDILVQKKKLSAYVHNGFWQNMDTLRDKHVLEDLWSSHHAPWKIWDDETGERIAD